MLNIQNNLLRTNFTSESPIEIKGKNTEPTAKNTGLESSPDKDTVEISSKENPQVTEPRYNIFNIQKDDGTNLTLKTTVFKGQTITGKIGDADVDLKNKIRFFKPRERSLKGTINGEEVNLKYKIDKQGNMIFDEETKEKYNDLISAFTELTNSKIEHDKKMMPYMFAAAAIHNMNNSNIDSLNNQMLQDQMLQEQMFQQQMLQNHLMQEQNIINMQTMGMM